MTTPTLRAPAELLPSRRLLELMPGIYRQRDATLGLDVAPRIAPLQGLVTVLGGALDELYAVVDQLWDDHFVERAQAAALPLLAELFGAHLLSTDVQAQRSLIANIVAWRRRKGTLATLEDALSETSRWDAEVDEGFRSLVVTQDLAHLAPWRGRTAITWDPIGLSDPLTRRAFSERRPRNDVRREREQLLAREPNETLDEALRRIGRIDSGRYAASPRVLDLRGWARPDAVLIRSSKLVAVELARVEVPPLVTLPHGQRGGTIDPGGRDTPLVWRHVAERPDLAPTLTARHEPPAQQPIPRLATGLLTPTSLAADPDEVERRGGFELAIDGVTLVGPPRPPELRDALSAESIGDEAVLHFAEDARPSPGDEWRVTVIAALPEVDNPTLTDRQQLQARLGPNGPLAPVVIAPDAHVEIAGRTIDLVVERVAGQPTQRAADGTWSSLAIDPALGPAASNATPVAVGAATWIVRIERDVAAGTNRLVRAITGAPAWAPVVSLPAPLDREDGIAITADGGVVYVASGDPTNLGVWTITGLGGTVAIKRIDAVSPRKPIARSSPSLCITGGRLYIYGGDDEGAAAGDMWSLPVAGGPWQPHPIRRQEDRVGATLIPTAAGIVLVGGDAVPGTLTTTCRLWAVATSRSWRPLPSLPFAAGPGLVVARAIATGIEAIVWADRTRPVRCVLPTGASAWQIGAIEALAPNPPAPGEAIFVADRLWVIGPAPLPSSDLVFTQGDHGVLAVLPRLAFAAGDSVRLRVGSDGATFRRDPPTPAETARPRPLDTRFGGLLADEALAAPPGDNRFSQPGRLTRVPWRIVQRSLGPWTSLVAPADADEGSVFLDPRLGRFVLPADAPTGRVTATCRIGRGGLIGAGLVPPDRAIPDDWREPDPDLAVETPLDFGMYGGVVTELDPHAYIAPHRSGQYTNGPEGAAIRIVDTVDAAIAAAPTGQVPRVAILGSARVPTARISDGADAGCSIVAADPDTTPIVDRDKDDLSLLLQTAAGSTPRYWLAGLWLLGRLELVAERGAADIRYCQIGAPGRVSLWVPGAGHQDLAARRSLPRAELEIRIYGCQLGVVELPPWVRLVAAGCTFDAGARDATAIRAAGAQLRLRHCTVHGIVEAGKLEASSSVFAGEVRVDRADLGFIRHSLCARGGTVPELFASLVHTPSFITIAPVSPDYLVLAPNNGRDVFAVGEGASQPGAFGERGDHERELDARTREFLPIGMDPVHVDRTAFDLYRMERR
jgi:hypothetical protein